MNLQTLAIFFAASILLALTPGPDIVTVIVRSISQGTRAGLAASLGFACGLTVHTTLAAVGVAAMLKASPHAVMVLRIVGCAYILYLAVRVAMDRSAIQLDQQSQPARRLRSIFGQSVLMNVLNPKVTLFFLSFLPGFVDTASRTPPAVQTIVLGLLFAVATVLCFGTCAVFAGSISTFIRRKPAANAFLRWGTVVVFIAIAAWLAFG